MEVRRMVQNQIKLSQAAASLGVSPQELKKWESEFSSFIEIGRDETNARVYTTTDLQVLEKIRNMKEMGTNSETIAKLLAMQNIHVSNRDQNNHSVEEGKGSIQQISELTEAILSSISGLQKVLEESGNSQSAKIERKMAQMENNITAQLINVSRDVQKNSGLVELTQIEKKIDCLTSTSMTSSEEIKTSLNNERQLLSEKIDVITENSLNEREMYREELVKIGESFEQKIAERDSRFIEMVQHRRRQVSRRGEGKFGLGYLKSLFAAVPSKS